jgi:hypothetical protein
MGNQWKKIKSCIPILNQYIFNLKKSVISIHVLDFDTLFLFFTMLSTTSEYHPTLLSHVPIWKNPNRPPHPHPAPIEKN